MEFLAPECEDTENPQACFLGIGAEGLEAACDYLDSDSDRHICYIQAGAASSDYTVIERRFADGEERDTAYAMLAVTAYDDTVLPLIEDNEKHDLAYIYTMVVTAIGQDVAYDASYCDGLRGNYDSEYPEDADLNAALCLDAVNLVSAVQALDEEELDEFIDDLRTALEAPNADEALTDLLHRLLEDEDGSEQQIIIEQGERWCYQDSSNIGTCSQMIWVVYDPVTNTLNEVFEYVGNNTYETSRERERRSLVDGEVVVETYVVVIQMIVVNERLIERHNIFPSGRIDIDIFTLDY